MVALGGALWDSHRMSKKRTRRGESMRIPDLASGLIDSVSENTGWEKVKCVGFLCELAACALDFNGCDAARAEQLKELYRATVEHHDYEQIAAKQMGKTLRKVREIKARMKTKIADTLGGVPATRYQPTGEKAKVSP